MVQGTRPKKSSVVFASVCLLGLCVAVVLYCSPDPIERAEVLTPAGRIGPPKGLPVSGFGAHLAITDNRLVVSAAATSLWVCNPETGKHTSALHLPGNMELQAEPLIAADESSVVCVANYRQPVAYVFDLEAQELRSSFVLGDPNSPWTLTGALAFKAGYMAVGGIDAKRKGVVYVFDSSSGRKVHVLRAQEPLGGDVFGQSVAISSKYIAVGAPRVTATHAKCPGVVVVFDLATGRRATTLATPVDGSCWQFGFSVAMFNDRLVVGAPTHPHSKERGRVFVYDIPSATLLGELRGSGARIAEKFGVGVAMSEERIIVGAASEDSDRCSGAAYVYEAGSLELVGRLTTGNAPSLDGFGQNVAVAGTRAFVGAALTGFVKDEANCGEVYVFDTAGLLPGGKRAD